jgi:hypothetical protein
MVRDSIDVMQVKKNVCEALISTLLDITCESKDTLKTQMDLEDMKLRKDLYHKIYTNESKKLPTVCYTQSKQETMSLCYCLLGIKVSISYSANVSRFVSMKTLKVCFKKSHDRHMFMVQILIV